MTDLELMKQQLEEMLKKINDALGVYTPPPFKIKTITAQEGKVYRRLHDGMLFGNQILLGYDYSTGVKRVDKPIYYEQIDDEGSNEPSES